MFRVNIKNVVNFTCRFRNLFSPIVSTKHFINVNNYKPLASSIMTNKNTLIANVQQKERRNNSCVYNYKKITMYLSLSILSWLGFADNDEEKESELIMTLKRAVLATKREQYDKAEQLLHLALRLAQQQQNEQGILYCYDLMANLAFDRLELNKAEKLFVSVLQKMLADGTKQDDLKVIHISLKIARICHLKAEEEKAEIGYKWCLEKIENQIQNNFDAKILYGVIHDWYAQYLLDRGDVQNSLSHLKEAYLICHEVKGGKCEESMLLLNDLGITSWRAGDLEGAESFLSEAISCSKTIEDKSHMGVVLANLGLIYIQKGIMEKATQLCKEAWQLGRRHENTESIEQANYCLEQIRQNLKK